MKVFIDIGMCRTGTNTRAWYYTHLNVNLFNKKKAHRPFLSVKQLHNEKVNLIAENSCSVDSFVPGYYRPHPYQIARRLKELFPDAGIIVVHRDEHDSIISRYNEFVEGGFTGTIKEWEDSHVYGRMWEYDRYYAYLKKLFDKKVLILDYDDYKHDYMSIFEPICEFMDVEYVEVKEKVINKGFTPVGMEKIRYEWLTNGKRANNVIPRDHFLNIIFDGYVRRIQTVDKPLQRAIDYFRGYVTAYD